METLNKVCKKCQIEKGLCDYYSSTRTSDGYLGICKLCCNAAKQKWKAENPNKAQEYYDNSLKRQGKTRLIRLTAEEKRARQAKNQSVWRKKDRLLHPEKYKTTAKKLEWQKQDRLNNPDKYKKHTKTFYDRHRESLLEKTRAWALANREYVALRQKQYSKSKVINLQDSYIKLLIRGKNALINVPIPDVLVEAKRLEILIKRRVKHEDSNRSTK